MDFGSETERVETSPYTVSGFLFTHTGLESQEVVDVQDLVKH